MPEIKLEVNISTEEDEAQQLPPAMTHTLALAKAIRETFPDDPGFSALVFKAAMHAEFFRQVHSAGDPFK